jgi:hypothetical protein
MESGYIEQRDGGYWIKGTRISLDSMFMPLIAERRPNP